MEINLFNCHQKRLIYEIRKMNYNLNYTFKTLQRLLFNIQNYIKMVFTISQIKLLHFE